MSRRAIRSHGDQCAPLPRGFTQIDALITQPEPRRLGPVACEPRPHAATTRGWLKNVCVDASCCELLTDIGDSRPFVTGWISGVALDKCLKVFYCLSSSRIPIHFSCFNRCHR